jgi:guanosine-3',5'-bis(diphosphate) 3'-pyrophosphohydrolase
MSDPNTIIFEAASFAARAHKNQFRKDNITPYFSHPTRVCLVVRQLFGFDDPAMLAAALLHDTIEDTTTDCDNIIERFGPTVAKWVAALSKDSRLPYDSREDEYTKTLTHADWQVKVIKLADLYDNLGDCRSFSKASQRRTTQKAHFYLAAIRQGLPATASHALQLVEQRLAEIESGLTT